MTSSRRNLQSTRLPRPGRREFALPSRFHRRALAPGHAARALRHQPVPRSPARSGVRTASLGISACRCGESATSTATVSETSRWRQARQFLAWNGLRVLGRDTHSDLRVPRHGSGDRFGFAIAGVGDVMGTVETTSVSARRSPLAAVRSGPLWGEWDDSANLEQRGHWRVRLDARTARET